MRESETKMIATVRIALSLAFGLICAVTCLSQEKDVQEDKLAAIRVAITEEISGSDVWKKVSANAVTTRSEIVTPEDLAGMYCDVLRLMDTKALQVYSTKKICSDSMILFEGDKKLLGGDREAFKRRRALFLEEARSLFAQTPLSAADVEIADKKLQEIQRGLRTQLVSYFSAPIAVSKGGVPRGIVMQTAELLTPLQNIDQEKSIYELRLQNSYLKQYIADAISMNYICLTKLLNVGVSNVFYNGALARKILSSSPKSEKNMRKHLDLVGLSADGYVVLGKVPIHYEINQRINQIFAYLMASETEAANMEMLDSKESSASTKATGIIVEDVIIVQLSVQQLEHALSPDEK